MPANEYHLVTHWRVQAEVAEVIDVLTDAPSLARWWPSSYLEVREVRPGDKHSVNVLMKGWLPYTLRLQLALTESDLPTSFALAATGEIVGRGVWYFRQDGPATAVTYDWRVRSEKPLLRSLSFVFKPIFAANHYWVMRRGEESLKLELARRSAISAEERARISPPPGPTPSSVPRFLLALPWLLLRR